MSKREWTPVTAKNPCPVCGGTDWCAWAESGRLKCDRNDVAPPGMVRMSKKGSGGIFRFADDRRTPAPRPKRAKPTGVPSFNGDKEQVRFLRALDPGQRQALADQLGVADSALKSIGCGWATNAVLKRLKAWGKDWSSRPDGAFTFPERDGSGRIVGFSLRPEGLGKGAFSSELGAHRGIVVPHNLADLPDPVLVVEGASDVAACLSMGLAAVGRPSNASGTDHLAELLRGRRTTVLGENDCKPDGTWPGRDGAISVSQGLAERWDLAVPYGLPSNDSKDVRSWLQAEIAKGLDLTDIKALAATGQRYMTSVSSGSTPPGGLDESWPIPEPLPDAMPPVDSFDPNLLPERFRAWAVDIAERTQCPIDYVAVSMMVALSSVVGRSIGIRPKRLDNWTVVPNLWGAVIGRPGMMKTPALQEALKPLRQLDLEAKHDHDELAKEIAAMEEVAKARHKYKQEQIKKAVRAGEDPRRLAMESIHDDDESAPTRRRYIVNDSTVEKLGEILNENPRGVLVYRDELIGLLKSLDKEGQEGARSFYLESWNGNGSYIYDRIGRGTIDIEAAILSLLGGIQPGPLQHYLRAVVKGGAGDDGLMQRFQLLAWPDSSDDWTNVDRLPDSDARRSVFDVFAGLDKLDPDIVGADHDPLEPDGIPFLRFAEDAQAIFNEWREEWEPRLRSGELPAVLETHLAKFRSLVPSLALLCHLADGEHGPVGAAHLLKAIAWTEYLESHARRVYASAMNPDVVAARALGKHVLAGQVKDGFALRDVYRKGWSGLNSAEDAKDGAAHLVDLGWLSERHVRTEGRTGTIYLINPTIPGLKNTDTPADGTARTDGSALDTPSGGSVVTDRGASCENEGGDKGVRP